LSYDKAHILSRNVTTRDGKLLITAKRETIAGRDFTTGYIDTIGKFSQRYGRWEIRAKVPTLRNVSRGIWPAFWLRDDKAGGELDVLEAWGHPRIQQEQFSGMSHMVAHERTNGTGRKKELVWENEIRKQTGTILPQVGEDFHTWAIEFTPEHLKGYYDGMLVFTHTPTTVPWLWGPEFANPLNIRLNMQIGQNYHGNPIAPDYKDTLTPAEFAVDYVRVWALPG
jgi:beta-glucanase (GH16 family)